MKSVTRNAVLVAAIPLALSLTFGAAAQTTSADGKASPAARADLERALDRVSDQSRDTQHPEGSPVSMEPQDDRRPVLGVVLAPTDRRGVLIAGVTPDSSAARAGLRSGDRLISIGGQRLDEKDSTARTEQARRMLATLTVGEPIALEYERGSLATSISVAPRLGEPAMIMPGNAELHLGSRLGGGIGDRVGPPLTAGGRLQMEHGPIRNRIEPVVPRLRARDRIRHAEITVAPPPGVAPGVHQEIIRLRPQGECGEAPCELPLIADALRWNGLNLASVDAQLGRYFGADRGVLVLSTLPELGGLQAGDVIRSIDGRPVSTPREAMAALRGREAGTEVEVAYLRDRKPGATRISVPEAMPVHMPSTPSTPSARSAPPAPDATPATR